MPLPDKLCFLITSNEPWGDIWYSKQNYAYELSKRYPVVFINPPRPWKLSNLWSNPLDFKEVRPNLYSLDYGNYYPIRSAWLNRLNNARVSAHLRTFLQKQGFSPSLLWAFDPLRLYHAQALGASLGVFHAVDHYYFQYLGERELCTHSDLLFATSQDFLDVYAEFEAPKHLVPHGISSEEFELDPQVLAAWDEPLRDYGLYVGVIDHRLDFALFEQAIQAHPQEQFVFVGPLRLPPNNPAAERIFTERRYANAHIWGPRHFKQLKYYIHQAKFCLSFMDMNYHANTVHHHKTLVYLCQGKPVFSFAYSADQGRDRIIYREQTGEALLGALAHFLQNGEAPELAAQRLTYARQYSFEAVLDRALNLVEAAWTKRYPV